MKLEEIPYGGLRYCRNFSLVLFSAGTSLSFAAFVAGMLAVAPSHPLSKSINFFSGAFFLAVASWNGGKFVKYLFTRKNFESEEALGALTLFAMFFSGSLAFFYYRLLYGLPWAVPLGGFVFGLSFVGLSILIGRRLSREMFRRNRMKVPKPV